MTRKHFVLIAKIIAKCGGAPESEKYNINALLREQARKLYEYEHGRGYIQEVFPELDKFEREFVKTGYCSKCQEEIFGAKKEKEYSF